MFQIKIGRFLILACVCQIISSFTIEELKPVHYEVDILKTPIKKGEKRSHPSIFMKSKFGQEYECWLPVVDDDEVSKKESIDSDKNIDIKELLKPIQTCLLKVQDWWTYELCPGLYIKQFHIEDGHILGPVVTLGIYESDFDWTNETNHEKFKHVTRPYHSQWYVNGTNCDLTGQPRNAEIRMFCEPDARDYIYRVDEHETCSYVITIHTSRICSYPPLKPIPAKKAHTIPCHPVLSEEQYNKYTQKVNEEQKLVDEKRSQWLNNQQERLQVMKKENLQQMANEEISKKSHDKVLEKEVVDKVEELSPKKLADASAEEVVTHLGEQFDQEIERLKSFLSSDKFSTRRNNAQERFETLLIQALREINENPDLSEESIKANFQKLISTFELLLKKSEMAEKNILKDEEDHTKEQEIFSEPISEEDKFSTMTNNAQKHFETLLIQAMKELTENPEVSYETIEEQYEKLASKFDLLLKKSEMAEKDFLKDEDHTKEQEILSEPISEEDSDETSIEKYDTSKIEIERDDDLVNEGSTSTVKHDQKQVSLLDDDQLHVRIRRLDRRSPDENGKLHEMDSSQRKKLEQAIKEKLEKSILDTGGRNIEVKIITAGFYNNDEGKDLHILSDDETTQMIMSLLVGQQEAVQEMERHKNLEESYQFNWEKKEEENDD